MKKSEGEGEISSIVAAILRRRGVETAEGQRDFLEPSYDKSRHDPFLLPDMRAAVDRIIAAKKNDEKITIYGDYDIDGMTATVVLWESLQKFGLDVETYTPDRFTEGYGLNIDAVEQIAKDGTKLIITVDNGTLSFDEIARAKELGVDVIVTDHHSPHEDLPDAVAILNPKVVVARNPDSYDEKFLLKKNASKKLYPFCDLCGVGVAFKLVQALQQETVNGKRETGNRRQETDSGLRIADCWLSDGQEKWLLDLVALGTVCDVVGLVDENRANVKWGLEVLKKTRRPGLKAILATAGADPKNVDARTLGFVIGPRLNAAGRLETAKIALELLKTDDEMRALALAEKLEEMNKGRRAIQDEIFGLAAAQIDENDSVAIAAGDDWHEGVIGIVAAKILEKFEKPAFVLSCGTEFAKGSGRSFGEFSCAAAIHHTDTIIEKGGGHLAAGGLTVRTERVTEWKMAIQTYYKSLGLKNQREFLYPAADLTLMNFADLTTELLDEIKLLEPFGQANPAPVFEFANVVILARRTMGRNNEHVKYTFADSDGRKFTAVAFGAAGKFIQGPFDDEGNTQHASILIELTANEWNGRVTVEGRLIRMGVAA